MILTFWTLTPQDPLSVHGKKYVKQLWQKYSSIWSHNVNGLLHAASILQITPTIMSENDTADIKPCRQFHCWQKHRDELQASKRKTLYFNFLGFCFQLFGMSLKITFVNFLSNWYHPEGPHRAKNHWFYLSSCFHFRWGWGGVRMILWLFWKESNIIENQVLQEIPRY